MILVLVLEKDLWAKVDIGIGQHARSRILNITILQTIGEMDAYKISRVSLTAIYHIAMNNVICSNNNSLIVIFLYNFC